MSITVLYWHWLLFSVALLMVEVFLPTFTIFWFGLGGVIVAVLLWLFPGLDLSWQLLIWALTSSLFAVFWFSYLKPRMVDKTKAGIAREAVMGQTGQVINAPLDEVRGTVRFTTPLLGDDEWPFVCEQTVAVGDRVIVKDILGNALIVTKI